MNNAEISEKIIFKFCNQQTRKKKDNSCDLIILFPLTQHFIFSELSSEMTKYWYESC